MDKTPVAPPPIANAADYVDALTRPRTQDLVIKKKVIPGRRMRDKLREQAVAVEIVREPD
jgi:hypothetical protein